MRSGEQDKENMAVTSQRRRRLSDITNLSLSTGWSTDHHKRLLKNNEVQQAQEIASLKCLLAEKELALDAQAEDLEHLRKEFSFQRRRQAQVNEEIICYNARLSKEAGMLRDQVKLVQHEYCQMMAACRINQSELQAKLTEAQELLTRVQQEKEGGTEVQHPTVRKPRSSTERRCSMSKSTGWSSKQSTVRSRAEISSSVLPYKVHPNNRYCNIDLLEPMIEGSEEGSPQKPTRASVSASESRCKLSLRSDKRASSVTSCSGSNIDKHASNPEKCESCTSIDSNFRNQTSRCDSETSTSETLSRQLRSGKTEKANVVSREAPPVTLPPSSATHFSRRAGTGTSESARPVRRAAENVASYKERPLNTKMRRPE